MSQHRHTRSCWRYCCNHFRTKVTRCLNDMMVRAFHVNIYIHVSDAGTYICLSVMESRCPSNADPQTTHGLFPRRFIHQLGEQRVTIMTCFFFGSVSLRCFVSRDLSSHVAASSIRSSGCYSRLDRVWLFHGPSLWLDIRWRTGSWLRRIGVCFQPRRWDVCVRVWDSVNSLGQVRPCRESCWLWRVRLGFDIGRVQSQWLVADTLGEPTLVSLFWYRVLLRHGESTVGKQKQHWLEHSYDVMHV